MQADRSGLHGKRQTARAELAERLRARRLDIELAIFERIREPRFGPVGHDDAEYVAGLRAATGASLEHALAAIEGAPAAERGEPVPPAALEQARRAARLGVGLDTVLRRYVAGYALLEQRIAQEVEADPALFGGTVLRDVLEAVGNLVERLIGAASEAYSGRVEPARVHSEVARLTRPSPAQRRERIMAAIVEVVAERGYSGATVAMAVERARVSRRTFYEVFPDGLDGGLYAVMDWVLAQLEEIAARRLERSSSWRDGVLEALAETLLFFDSDRPLARVCFIETMAGDAVRKHRERNARALRAIVVPRIEALGLPVQPLVAEAVMASLLGMIYAHLASAEQGPLIQLLGPLLSAAAMPFVPDERTALEEKARGERLAGAIQAGDPAWAVPPKALGGREGERAAAGLASVATGALPSVLANADARRARECLLYVAAHPGSSNGEIAAGIGVAHRSQISLLLSELASAGLVERWSEGAGKRNAWKLSAGGEEAASWLGSSRPRAGVPVESTTGRRAQ